MVTAKIEQLLTILQKAKENGCTKVKLQLYDNWKDVVKQQVKPSQPIDEYKIDTRFYNTVEFKTEIEGVVATDRIITQLEKDTLIIRVSLSDRDSLLNTLGIADLYKS